MGRAGAIIMAMSLIGCASATMSEDAGGVDATPDALFDADLPLDAAPVMDVDVFVAPDMALSPVDAHLPVDAAPDVLVSRVGSVAIAGQATFYAHALGEPMVNPPNRRCHSAFGRPNRGGSPGAHRWLRLRTHGGER